MCDIPLRVDWEDVVRVTGEECMAEQIRERRSHRSNLGFFRFCDEDIIVIAEDTEHPPSAEGAWHIFPRGCVKMIWRLDAGRRIEWAEAEEMNDG